MQWWIYVLIAVGLVVLFDVLVVLWLGIATSESSDEALRIARDDEH
jgi:hypothetical protein